MLFKSLYALATILLVFNTIMLSHDLHYGPSQKKKKSLKKSLLNRGAFLAIFLLWPFYLYNYLALDTLMVSLGGLGFYYGGVTLIYGESMKSSILNILKTFLGIGLGLFALYLYFSVLSPILLSVLISVFLVLFLVVFDRFHPRILKRLFRVVPYLHNSDEGFINDKNIHEQVHMIEIDGFKSMKNAMIVGVFKPLRVYVSKAMLESMKHDEVMGVIAHEVGHVKKNHLKLRMILGLFSIMSLFFVGILVFNFESRPLFDYTIFVLAMIILGTLYRSLFALLLQKQEFEADAYTKLIGQSENLIAALNKLKKGEPKVHNPLFHLLRASHPPTQVRIERLKEMK